MTLSNDEFDLTLRNGKVFATSGLVDADIGVREGKIADMGSIVG